MNKKGIVEEPAKVILQYLNMIKMIITYACPRCRSSDLVKNGHDYKGAQKFRCKACGRYGTLDAQSGYDGQTRHIIHQAVRERLSLRGIERVFSLSRRTVSRWLKQWIDQVPPLEKSLVEAHSDDVLELDELWSFVGSKAHVRWLWLALCCRTRQVVAYWLGDRSETSAIHLWERLPHAYVRCHSFSDKWEAYRYVFDYTRHRQVNKDEGETNHVERWFNTLRQRLGRFTRKTLSFSKREICMKGSYACFFRNTISHASVNVSPLPC
jgi:insertion element IS1 protein InsB